MVIRCANVSNPDRFSRDNRSAVVTGMSMMRVAVAGTGGLARTIAHTIAEETSHQVVLLSRTDQPHITAQGYHVLIIDYNSSQSLQFALRGIDTVVSTVTGQNQIELIKAAVQAKVRRFAPAEFEGPPSLRPHNDPLDRSRTLARQWLHYYARHIQATIFVCGIFYERFQPGGLQQSLVGINSGFGGEGDYIANCRTGIAQAPLFDANNQPGVTICMTAMEDVGRFVTRALDLPQWNVQSEMRMRGERITVRQLLDVMQQLLGRQFTINPHNPTTLSQALQVAQQNNSLPHQLRIHSLLSTAAGRYDFTPRANGITDLNVAFADLQTIPFAQWFVSKWALALAPIPTSAITTTTVAM